MRGSVIEHVGETPVRPEHLGIGSGCLRDEVQHDVALRGTHARETNASECAKVLPGDGPGPNALDLVHLLQSVHEEGGLEPARGIQPRRGGCAAKKEAAQH